MANAPKKFRCACGTSIVIETPPKSFSSIDGWLRLYDPMCPACRRQMTLYLPVTPEAIIKKFKISLEDRHKVYDRFRQARFIIDDPRSIVRKVATIDGSDVYEVRSPDKDKSYVVSVREPEFYQCNCPDHIYRAVPCKHLIAVMMKRDRGE